MTRRRRLVAEREQTTERFDRVLREIREDAVPQAVDALERLMAEIEGGHP